jgi:hypothetical protein
MADDDFAAFQNEIAVLKEAEEPEEPEEKSFVDDDGTTYVWDPSTGKFKPEGEEVHAAPLQAAVEWNEADMVFEDDENAAPMGMEKLLEQAKKAKEKEIALGRGEDDGGDERGGGGGGGGGTAAGASAGAWDPDAKPEGFVVKPCFAFQKGKCERGDKCKFSHDAAEVAAAGEASGAGAGGAGAAAAGAAGAEGAEEGGDAGAPKVKLSAMAESAIEKEKERRAKQGGACASLIQLTHRLESAWFQPLNLSK